MDSAIGIATNMICCLFGKLYEQIKYLRSLEDDLHRMQRLFRSVDATKNDITSDLKRRERNALEVVRVWMDDVQNTADRVSAISNDYSLHKRCFFGCCPDCWFLLTLSTDIRHCIADIEELSNRGNFDSLHGGFGEVPPPPATVAVPGKEHVGTTPRRAQSQIQQWLADDQTRIIGVYGMGGVGKTSLVKNINNSPFVKAQFDVVILAAVSQKLDIQSLQNAIASRLGSGLPADNMDERRATLYNYLRKKKYLLLLDDLWDKIDLAEQLGVGVPCRGDGCKIVVTTRDQTVCHRMLTDQLLELKTLSPEEGWDLFRRQAFRDGLLIPPPIEAVAREIAAQCNGLPLALNCLAAAMRSYGTDLRHWKSAFNSIETVDPSFYSISHSHVNDELFQRLRWSYDSLPQDLKPCFIDCAIYQSQHQILSFTDDNSLFPIDTAIRAEEELIPIWMAEGLLGGDGDGDDLFQKGRDFIHTMRNRCLIDTIDPSSTELQAWVKVHDVLRDLAILIGKERKSTLVRAGNSVVDFPLETECGRCMRISLVDTKIQSLPTNFKCDGLVSLVVSGSQGLKHIPEDFLEKLPSLKVLDLSGTRIASLPTSLGMLKELAFLNLTGTRIKDLPDSIGALTCLQFLHLDDCNKLTSLPLTISKLRSLRSLRLEKCEKLSVLGNEICHLTSLEILTMWNSNIFIGEKSSEMGRNEICLKDLAKLRRLRELSLQVKSPITEGLMGSCINMKFLRLIFTQTNQEDLPGDMRAMDQLEYFVLKKCNAVRLPDWIPGFQTLSVFGLRDCHHLTELPELSRLPSLKVLMIGTCNELRNLWMEGGSDGRFPALETIMLSGLPSLESLVGGVLEDGAMPNLKHLLVEHCNKLKVLPSGIEKRLEDIRGAKDWWDAIVWESDHIKNRLQNVYVKLACKMFM